MKSTLFYFALLTSFWSASQTLTISDNSTREKLGSVILSDKNNKVVSSNNNGTVDISVLDKNGEISVYHPSHSLYVLSDT